MLLLLSRIVTSFDRAFPKRFRIDESQFASGSDRC